MLALLFLVLVALAVGVGVLLVRSVRARADRSAWLELSVLYPASGDAYVGRRFEYPDTGGEAVIGDEGFWAQPAAHMSPIEVPWEKVRSVRAGAGGGLNAHVRGGVVVLPGAASAAVAEVIQRRARRRQAQPV